MKNPTLEVRVALLESRVAQLGDELRSVEQKTSKDWRRTIGMFTDDEDMKAIFQEALKLREADRKKTRSKVTGRQKSKR